MKKITKRDILKLAEVAPDNCIIITVFERDGILLNGRLTENEYRGYKSRYILWSDYFSVPNSNIWDYLAATEQDSDTTEVCIKDTAACFMEHTAEAKAYAVTELEFNENVPILRDGTYALFVERRERV